jgi:hypothetical protein
MHGVGRDHDRDVASPIPPPPHDLGRERARERRRDLLHARVRHGRHEDRHDLDRAVGVLQERQLRLDRVLDALHLVVHDEERRIERRDQRVAKRRDGNVAVRPAPVREPVEDDAVLEPERARLVRDAHDDHGLGAYVRERQWIHEARVRVVVVRRDRHAPGGPGRESQVLAQHAQDRPGLALLDAAHHRVHLGSGVGETDGVGEATEPCRAHRA